MRNSFPKAHKKYGSEPVSEADYVRVQELITKGISRLPLPSAIPQEPKAYAKRAAKTRFDCTKIAPSGWAILELLENCRESVAPSWIVDTLRFSPATTRRHLTALKEMGLVDSLGSTNSIRYWATDLGIRLSLEKGVER